MSASRAGANGFANNSVAARVRSNSAPRSQGSNTRKLPLSPRPQLSTLNSQLLWSPFTKPQIPVTWRLPRQFVTGTNSTPKKLRVVEAREFINPTGPEDYRVVIRLGGRAFFRIKTLNAHELCFYRKPP